MRSVCIVCSHFCNSSHSYGRHKNFTEIRYCKTLDFCEPSNRLESKSRGFEAGIRIRMESVDIIGIGTGIRLLNFPGIRIKMYLESSITDQETCLQLIFFDIHV